MQASPVRRLVVSCLRCQASTATASTSTSTSISNHANTTSTPRRILSAISRRRRIRNDDPAPPEDPAKYLSGYTQSTSVVKPYFDLSAFHKMLDIHPSLQQTSRDGSLSIVYDEPEYAYIDNGGQEQIVRRFEVGKAQRAALEASAENTRGEAANPLIALANDAAVGFTSDQVNSLHTYMLVVHRVWNMTSKGKIPSMYCMVVTGNGNGLVGYGEGKAEALPAARDRAYVQAVKNMDYVQRKDQRTTWSGCMTGKWGATVVELRSRPPGFGLRCSPIIHQIAKAAGISDLSAKIRGSRNGMNTLKATFNLLHGGAAPLGLGDISGKEKLARRFKGVGMRTADEIALNLGRRPIELR